ncbi:GntR family transcriptional regulator [Dankookia sp. P2]|uniref:GntR family transcriptional regulator n=1 Tax=Dankookia sp. P2 TaxID=3423955 RepID=UPI003D66A8ED
MSTDDLAEDLEGPASRGRNQWAYERLHEAIREGAIEPGQRVMETEISAWLRVSRTPVREALRRLQAEGLLEPRGGWWPRRRGLRPAGDRRVLRHAGSLEGTAAALAARHADATELGILRAIMDGMQALPDDPRAHARENEAFHDHIYHAAHNRFLLKSLRALLNFVPLLGRTTYNAPGRVATALAEHQAIVAAILARDAARAEEAARLHIRNALENRMLVVTEDVRAASRRRSARPLPTGPADRRTRGPD